MDTLAILTFKCELLEENIRLFYEPTIAYKDRVIMRLEQEIKVLRKVLENA